ncbi:YetF domain-containing protein [Nonomuraea sp. NPDC049421]
MRRHHLDVGQVLQDACSTHGIRSLDEIDYATLERSGVISVIPKRP